MPRILQSMSLVLAALLVAAGAARADTIATTQITPSTTMGQYAYFSLDQINDGIVSDAYPYNGYASGFGVVSGRITLILDQAYDLSSFVLWNDVNVLNEGVRSFKLVFEDASGGVLGSTGTYTAVSQFAPQTYSFASVVSGVKTVHLDVLTSILQIEIRELAFNGTVTAVPEPATWALGLLGAAALAGWRRRC
jgi:MYXO-CTERM domain-containing protein